MPRRAPPSAPAPAASGKRAREHVADDLDNPRGGKRAGAGRKPSAAAMGPDINPMQTQTVERRRPSPGPSSSSSSGFSTNFRAPDVLTLSRISFPN